VWNTTSVASLGAVAINGSRSRQQIASDDFLGKSRPGNRDRCAQPARAPLLPGPDQAFRAMPRLPPRADRSGSDRGRRAIRFPEAWSAGEPDARAAQGNTGAATPDDAGGSIR